MRSRLPLVLLALVLALCFSACQDEPEPKIADPTPAPTTTTEATVTTPVPTTEVTSEPAKRETVKQFIRRLTKESTKAQRSGDTGAYEGLIRNCRACSGFVDFVHEVYANGGSIEIAWARAINIRVLRNIDGVRILEYTIRSGKTRYQERAGGPVKRLSAGDERVQVNVVREDGEWFMTRLSRLPS